MRRNHKDEPHAPAASESAKACGPAAPVGPVVPPRHVETKLELPVGEPDLEALRSVTRDWLVPALVEKFLRERGIELRARPNSGPGKTPISDL